MALKSAECAVPEINGRHPLIIGGGGIIRSLERYFTGGIAEVRIWNRERADISSDIEVEYVKGTFNATGEVVHMCFCESSICDNLRYSYSHAESLLF